jgi:drug/metabolite transporter (DMT)-like permease
MFSVIGLSLLAMVGLALGWFLSARTAKQIEQTQLLFWFQLLGIPFLLLLLPFITVPLTFAGFTQIFLVGVGEAFVLLQLLTAFKLGQVSVITPVVSSYSLITALLGIVLLNESAGFLKIIGMVCIVLGAILLSTKLTRQFFAQFREGLAPGMKQALFAMLGTGVYLFLVTLLARENGWLYSALFIRIAITIVTGLLLWRKKLPIALPNATVTKFVFAGAVCDVIGFSLYNFTVSLGETSVVSVITSAQSLLIVPLSIIFLKEKMQRQQIGGFITVLLGLILLQL